MDRCNCVRHSIMMLNVIAKSELIIKFTSENYVLII